jgi:hypothetical protein
MKRANLPFGSTPTPRDPDARRPGESYTRLTSSQKVARRAASQPAAPEAVLRRRTDAANAEEPRTGVVRRIDMPHTPQRAASPGAAREARAGVRPRSDVRGEPVPSAGARAGSASRETDEHQGGRAVDRAWRCLEWGQPAKEQRSRRDPKVSIAQLSLDGDLVRHSGPDAWLPETGDFMHKMAGLIARGFGFERCHSVCLKTERAVLAVSEVGGTKVMAVTGPARSLSNVLERAGLQ